jgi:hypothetical protein
MSTTLPSKSFPNHHSSVIRPFDATDDVVKECADKKIDVKKYVESPSSGSLFVTSIILT